MARTRPVLRSVIPSVVRPDATASQSASKLVPKKRQLEDENSEDSHTLAVKLLREPSHSDVVVVCRDKSWNCQRAILCQRCPFFRAALGGPFKEGIEARIDLSEDDPEAMDSLLMFLYTTKYDPTNNSPNVLIFRQAIHLFYTADKYQITKLKEAVHQEIKDWFHRNAFMILGSPGDQNVIDIYKCIKELWSLDIPGSDDIKVLIIAEMMKHAKDILGKSDLQDLFRDEPSFMMQYLTEVAKKLPTK